jgi:hypothetical protein
MNDLGIVVFGHRCTGAMRNVLESLRRLRSADSEAAGPTAPSLASTRE